MTSWRFCVCINRKNCRRCIYFWTCFSSYNLQFFLHKYCITSNATAHHEQTFFIILIDPIFFVYVLLYNILLNFLECKWFKNPFSFPKHQLKCISQGRISRIHISNFVIKPFFRRQMRKEHFSRLNKDWNKCFLILINFFKITISQPNDDNNDMKIQETFQNKFVPFFRGIFPQI